MKKKIVLFTHNDLDGIGCAILGKFALSHLFDFTYHTCSYGSVNNAVLAEINRSPNADFIFTDISMLDYVAEALNDRGNVLLFDHHPTAARLTKYDWATVTPERSDGVKTCGTEMFARYLINSNYLKNTLAIETLCESVRRWDTWDWKNFDDGSLSKWLNNLLKLYGDEKFIESSIIKIENNQSFFEFSGIERAMLFTFDSIVQKYAKEKEEYMRKMKIGDHNVGVIFASQYTSEVGDIICSLNKDIDYLAIVNLPNTVSIRSQSEHVDAGKDIAAKLGGGGHKGAAGFVIGSDNVKAIFDAVQNILTENK